MGSTDGYAGVAVAVLPPSLRVSSPLETVLQDALGSQYRLERELEAGGMSRLFLATDLRLKREVVVKVLPPDLVSVASTSRFKREIELTVRLQHPHILPVLTSGEFEDGLFYITPYIQGESLRARIERERKLPLDDILRILKDVSGALAFAHQRGIVHRDIKPGNILLSDGQAILADFGIARAVSTTATPLTESGVAPGTPAYMAPELPTDERADVYALGVVAYEMLCGLLPKPPVTAKRVLAERGSTRESREIARRLAVLVERALSPSPARRPQTSREFFSELSIARPMLVRRLSIGVGLATIVGGMAITTRLLQPASYDAAAYAVASFVSVDASVPEPMRRRISRGVETALGEWRDVRVLEAQELAGISPAGGDESTSLDGAKKLARRLRAHALVWGNCVARGDSIEISATLYDLRSGRAPRTRRIVVLERDDTTNVMGYRRLVNALLRDRDALPWRSAVDGARASLVAWRTIDAAQLALDAWNLSAAERSFAYADSVDPGNATSALGRAETLLLGVSANSLERFRAASHKAFEVRGQFSERDRTIAEGLVALAERRPVDACRLFGRLQASDSSDLMATVGVAECQRSDAVVVRDPRSASGWRFRASHEATLRAFQKLADLVSTTAEPRFSGWLALRLSRLLPTETVRLRQGFAVETDTIFFSARAFLDHDTIAFVPYDSRWPSSANTDPDPARQMAAIERNLGILRRAGERWVEDAPTDPGAYAFLADVVERSGTDANVHGDRVSALAAVRRAMQYSRGGPQQVALALSEVRLLVEASNFAAVRHAADSILSAASHSGGGGNAELAGLATLTGRGHLAAELLRDSSAFELVLPEFGPVVLRKPIADVALSLVAYSAVGGPADSVSALTRRFDLLLPSYVSPPAKVAAIRAAVLGRALSVSYPGGRTLLAGLPRATVLEVEVPQLLAAHDIAGARALLKSWDKRGYGHLPGAISVDGTYRHALFAAEAGDTAGAVHLLDGLLRALPTIGSHFLDRPEQAGCLVRAMAFRAILAARANDMSTARLWASPVVALWSGADGELRPLVDSVRGVAEPRR